MDAASMPINAREAVNIVSTSGIDFHEELLTLMTWIILTHKSTENERPPVLNTTELKLMNLDDMCEHIAMILCCIQNNEKGALNS